MTGTWRASTPARRGLLLCAHALEQLRHGDLLAEVEGAVDRRVDDLALPAPHPDQREQAQEGVVEVGSEPQVRGVVLDGQVRPRRQVGVARVLGALARGPDGLVAAGALGHLAALVAGLVGMVVLYAAGAVGFIVAAHMEPGAAVLAMGAFVPYRSQ